MRICTASLSIYLSNCAASAAARACRARRVRRNAYVIMHYEGTERDDEYVLAARVLVRSIQASGAKFPVVIMAAENVRQSVVDTFGARVLACMHGHPTAAGLRGRMWLWR